MRGLLALVSGPAFAEAAELELELLKEAGVKAVSVVPTGAAYEFPHRVVEAARAQLSPQGIEVKAIDLLTRRDALDPGVISQLSDSEAVFLAGPSPMHLRSVLKDSPAWQVIVDGWENGSTLIASGGAAAVLCDPMVDPRGGAFTVGLGLLNAITVIPGFDGWSDDAVHRTRALAPKGVALVGLASNGALVNRSGVWSGAGSSAPVVYSGPQTVGLETLPALS